MRFLRTCFLLLGGALATAKCAGAPETGTRLHSLVLSAKTDVSPPFGSVDFVYGPKNNGGRWWQLEIRAEAAATNTPLCTMRALTAEDPLDAATGALHFERYQLRASETNEALEYVEARSGKALLPPWENFQKYFVPRAASGARWQKGVPQTCEFLGHILTLES